VTQLLALSSIAAGERITGAALLKMQQMLSVLFSFRQMNNHPLNARLVLASPTVKKNTVDRDPTRARENPEKKEPNAVGNQVQKACDDGHIEKKET
jgi:hypothetical protein